MVDCLVDAVIDESYHISELCLVWRTQLMYTAKLPGRDCKQSMVN